MSSSTPKVNGPCQVYVSSPHAGHPRRSAKGSTGGNGHDRDCLSARICAYERVERTSYGLVFRYAPVLYPPPLRAHPRPRMSADPGVLAFSLGIRRETTNLLSCPSWNLRRPFLPLRFARVRFHGGYLGRRAVGRCLTYPSSTQICRLLSPLNFHEGPIRRPASKRAQSQLPTLYARSPYRFSWEDNEEYTPSLMAIVPGPIQIAYNAHAVNCADMSLLP